MKGSSRGWRKAAPSRRGGVALGVIALLLFGFVNCSQGESSGVSSPPPVISAAPTKTVGIALANETFIAVAKQANASVVTIASTRKRAARQQPFPGPSPFFDDPFFRRFFGEPFERRFPAPQERQEQGLGSGVIVNADGYIVTNHHVIEQAEEIIVLLPDKRRLKATLIGADPKTDLAVVKIEAANLPTLPWGDSSRLQVGEVALAVGNPFGLNQTVTMGIISAVGRANMGIVDYEDFIQTDAAINPGNSGGALVNLNGELIGISTAIFTRTGGYMGIGFAIPSNMVRSVMTSLIKHGKVVRGWLGVSIQELTDELAKQFDVVEAKGALVSDVMEDSPAAKAKLERGDIITAYNNVAVKDPVQLRSLVADTEPGTTVTVTIFRDKKMRDVKVAIGELPKTVSKARGPGERGRGEHALAGVGVEPLAPEDLKRLKIDGGVAVTEVERGSPADRAGLRQGDIIREINRKRVRTVEDFERLVDKLEPEASALLLVHRGTASIFLSIKPE
ncbi:MAG: DegQ family serine endoprotease [Nitrospira sp.]|nr:DegQ family serine endoprotease [Nitrospira sp.]